MTSHGRENEELLSASEERYRAFIANSSEGIWRFELAEPVPTDLSEDEQIELFFAHGYLAECNDAMARMYGLARAADLNGARLSDMLVRTDPQNTAYLRAFIRSGYRLTDAESVETDREGRPKYFLNNLIGVIEGGRLRRAWGTQRDITSQRTTEENLKLYGHVLDSMIEGVSLADERGYIVYTNPAEDLMFGYERGELIGQHVTVQNLYPPEENERIVGQVIEQLRQRGAWFGEFPNRKKDGTPFTTFARITALDISGKKYWVCVQEDVSERKWAERALRESEERLRLAQRAARIGTWEWDLRTGEVSWSEGIWDLLGLARGSEEPGLKPFLELIHPEDRERVRQHVEAVLAEEEDYYDEFRLLLRDGSVRWIASKGRVIRAADGTAARLIGVNLDIAERKAAEQLLTASEERLALAQEAGNIGTFDWDIVTGEVTWTEKLELIFGLPPGGFGGTFENWRERVHREDITRCEATIAEALSAGAPDWQAEYRMFRADTGEMRWIEARSRIFYAAGRPVRMVGVNLDITERKAAEAERERLLRRAELARATAEEAGRLKDEFLATVSHELRTPLTAMLGWAHLLRSGRLDEESRVRALETIERNARAQAKIVEDILDVSRIITGKLRLNIQPVDPVSLIESALESIRPAAEAKGVRLQKELETGESLLSGDPARLQQVVWNLLSNAIKFTPRDGCVQVILRRADAHLELIVSDNGSGISPAFLPYVFDRFRQADGTTSRLHGGLGLGLAIVRHLVELHGGTVTAASEGEGRGATFTVRLPVAPVGTGRDPDAAGRAAHSRPPAG